MISVAMPWVLGLAVAGALITCVLHFLSVKRPPVFVLPTMRFLPDRPVRAVSRSARPSDLLLLLLRVAAVLLAGIAMAGVTVSGSRVTHGRIVVIDRGGAGTDSSSLRARALDALRGKAATARLSGARPVVATRIVMVDSAARVMSIAAMRTFKPDTLSVVPASATLSAALLAGVRAATVMVRDESNIDSVELDIVSPFMQAGDDAALRSVRTLWPGKIQLVRVATNRAPIDSAASALTVRFVGVAPNAAVLSAVTLAVAPEARGAISPTSASREQGAATARDTARAKATTVSIEWPANGMPAGWTAIAPDTIGAIAARGHALVWPFVRTALAPDSLLRHARAIAWWSDGRVAAVEVANGTGCTRQVGAAVSASANVLQGGSARALLAAIAGPCGPRMSAATMSDDVRRMLEGTGGAVPAAAFRTGTAQQTPFGSVMLLVALLLLAVEWWARDRELPAGDAARTSAQPLRKVA